MLADTAELAAHLALTGVAAYQAEMAKVVRSNQVADKSMGNISKTALAVGGSIGKGISTAVRNVERLGVVAGGFLVAQVKFGIDSLVELEKVTAQTNAVIKSTHGVAGETAKAIIDLSNKYEDLNATIDNKVIQSAENLLLTFTSVRKNAFEPALQAALDMNQALGGGEGGLQGTIIQVGKALQDPILGLTALRRVGVNFSLEQQKQIKTLIAHNKLYEAQKLILAELTKEFGGSFAAAGKTATGTFATLGDAIEDVQAGLAKALLPALTDVAKELTSLVKDHQGDIEAFGRSLGTGFKNAVAWAKTLDWKGIGDGLKTAAGAAKTLVDAFVHAPQWLQTAVITGWGLNKLTGGALTSIFGNVASGLLSRGSSPMVPMYVQQVGVGGVGGVGGAAGKAASIAQGVFIVGIAAEAADLIHGALSPGGGLEGRTGGAGGGLLPADQLRWPFGPKGTPNIDLGPFKNILGGDSSFGNTSGIGSVPKQSPGAASSRGGFTSNAVAALNAFTAAVRAGALAIEKNWLKSLDGIGARSKAKTGKDATPEQIAAIRTRDELHQLQVITEKSKASSDVKLERLRALAADAKAHGDTKTAAKVQAAIDKMKADIKKAQQDTTAAVNTGTNTLDAAVRAANSPITIYVTTSVSANDVVKTTTRVNRYGPSAPNTKSGPGAI